MTFSIRRRILSNQVFNHLSFHYKDLGALSTVPSRQQPRHAWVNDQYGYVKVEITTLVSLMMRPVLPCILKEILSRIKRKGKQQNVLPNFCISI